MTLAEILAALEALADLTADQLAELRQAISDLYADLRDGDLDDEAIAALEELVEARQQVDADLARRETERAAAEARIADLDAAMSDDDDTEGEDDDETVETDPDAETETEDADGGDAVEEAEAIVEAAAEGEDETVSEDERELVTASASRPNLRRVGRRQPPAAREPQRAELGHAVVTAATDVPGFAAGSRVSTEEAFGQALSARWASVAGTPGSAGAGMQKIPVLRVEREFDADLVIPARHQPEQANAIMDLAVERHLATIDSQVAAVREGDVLTAAGGPCVPRDVNFDVEFIGDDSRPFTNGFPTVGYPRGRISFYPPICFDGDCDSIDPDGQLGRVITADEDAAGYQSSSPAGPTVDKGCVRIDCPDEIDECGLDIMIKCITIGNWVDRTFPEYVRAWRSMVDVCYSRSYEAKHMAEVTAGSTLITAGPGTFGATLELIAQIMTIIERSKSSRRLPNSTMWAWKVPSWLLTYLKIDLSRYLGNAEAGFSNLSISDAQIIGWFRQHNVNLSWYIDESGPTAQGDNSILALPTAGALVDLPNSVRTFLFPEGTWIRGSGGTLDLGVYRDSALNAVNDFQAFMEEWTSMCKRGCDSYVIDHELCNNGLAAGTVVAAC